MWHRSLAVLMWKHFTVRKRRYIHTLIELISPVLIISVLFTCKYYLQLHDNVGALKLTTEETLSEPYLSFVLYTPNTKLAAELMDNVGAKLGMQRRTKDNSVDYNYYQYGNSLEIADVVANNKSKYSNSAIVIFEDLDGKDWWDRKTKKLAYTIRMRQDYSDNFMALQWSIDRSYIEALSKKTVSQALSLQKLPYFKTGMSAGMMAFYVLLPWLCWLSLFIVFVFLMSRLLEERTTGTQELIKMVGVSTNTLSLSHFLNVVPTGLMYAIFTTVLVKATDNPFIKHSDGLIVFVASVLHFVSVAGMAFACSYLVKSTQYTVSLSVLSYILLIVPATLVVSQLLPYEGVLFSGILPHVPIIWLWFEILTFEAYDKGLSFGEITSSHTEMSGPVLLGLTWLVVQAALFFSLAWYLSYVRPGNYGQALPWNFFCQKLYWTRNEDKPEYEEMEDEEMISRDMKYFEDTPNNLNVGIKIENVSKVFPKHKALRNVSLDVYEGEITVLLGHNGAGKTTLMSIITGMMSATEGKIYVNGMDSVSKREEVRSQLGLCPQHNLFFSDLTVLEHVLFFTLLKSGTYSDAYGSSMALLTRLGIGQKAHNKSAELSGGMKRRLQLACALAGGASVLVLDEPTSGLDVQSRRELWDLLLSLRGERTVLLTTHFMEEADALGDRVAALHLGRLRCHAAPMHLKKAIGTGYRLSFTTNGVPRDTAITDVVTSFVNDATVKEKTINSLSYNLPAARSAHFPNLFTSLEEKKSDLGIETIGVGVSTLEEVFLKLCSDTDAGFIDDIVDSSRIEPKYNKVTGCPLYWRQFCVLFKRQIKYIISKKLSFFILQALIPILMILMFTAAFNNSSSGSQTQDATTLDLDLYTSRLYRKGFCNVNLSGISKNTLEELYPNVEFTDTDNLIDAALKVARDNILEYKNYLVGIELNDNHSKVWYSNKHAEPVALNLLSNTIAAQYLPQMRGRAITTRNNPTNNHKYYSTYSNSDSSVKSPYNCFMWAIFIVFIILSTNINFASLPCKERASGARHIHIMAGCPAALHWLSTLAFHTSVCVLLLVIPTGIAAATLDQNNTFTQPAMIMTLMLILTLGSLAFFAFMYIVTFYFAERTTGIILISIKVVFGFLTSIIKIMEMFSLEVNSFLNFVATIAGYTMPPHALIVATVKCTYAAHINALCHLAQGACSNSEENPAFTRSPGFDKEKCCAGENPLEYFGIGNFSPGGDMIILTMQFLVYMTLVVLTQKGVFNSWSDRIFNRKIRNHLKTNMNPVDGPRLGWLRCWTNLLHRNHVPADKQIQDANVAMSVHDVHKNYPRIIGKSCYAVQGLSFSVKKGECFGLLGVNGAGKSTTFKMLTAEECTTKGEIYANGYKVSQEKDHYLRSLGYCPQFFGLDDFQTGCDNLQLLLTLRGLDGSDVSAEVMSWIDIVGLEKYSKRNVSSYSGGCTRRLAAAASLCSGAPLTLLDEPTAGVDVAARRRVWSALRRSLLLQRSVVITSHSMDEMEALCDRIGIMSGGELRALGTPAELRARHAQGHAVIIKLKQVQRDGVGPHAGANSEIDSLKSFLHTNFNCTLKDQHKTMLHYHINVSMRYSALFAQLESLQSSFPALVEDYSVTETTLEEVFLSFAKEPEPANTRNGVV